MPGYDRSNPQDVPNREPDKDELKAIILNNDAEKLNNLAVKLGKYYADHGDIKSSQIRKFHSNLLAIDKFDKNRLHLLRPILAYTVGREQINSPKYKKLKNLRDHIEACISIVNGPNSFKNFKNFFEAIIAYHRFHGGKE